MARHRHHETHRRLRSNADMDSGMKTHDAGLVVEEGIEIGLFGNRPHHCTHQERQER